MDTKPPTPPPEEPTGSTQQGADHTFIMCILTARGPSHLPPQKPQEEVDALNDDISRMA